MSSHQSLRAAMSDYDGVSDGKLLDTETDGSTVSTASNPGVSPAKIHGCIVKDGGGSRPVAGGECLRKLAARAFVREHKELTFDCPASTNTFTRVCVCCAETRPKEVQ